MSKNKNTSKNKTHNGSNNNTLDIFDICIVDKYVKIFGFV